MSKITITKNYNGRDEVLVQDAKLFTPYNNFSANNRLDPDDERASVLLILDDEDFMKYLENAEFYIKTIEYKGESIPTIKLYISYKYAPYPEVISTDSSSGVSTALTKETLHNLDTFKREDGFEHVDLKFTFHPYVTKAGKTGTSGYIDNLYVVPKYTALEQTLERIRPSFPDDSETVVLEEQNPDIPF